MDTDEKFSVWQFHYRAHECIAASVSLREATTVAVKLVNSGEGRNGSITRILILNNGDCIVFEWQYIIGIVFPPNLKGMRVHVSSP